jgi:hypothetical protein
MFQFDWVKKRTVLSNFTVNEFAAMLSTTVVPRGGIAVRLIGIIADELAPPSVIVNVDGLEGMRILAGVVSIDIKTTLPGVDANQEEISNVAP